MDSLSEGRAVLPIAAERQNKGMKLSKPEPLVGGWPTRLGIIKSGFAAYAPC